MQNEGDDENLAKVDALIFMVGNDDDAPQYSKSNALQVYPYTFNIRPITRRYQSIICTETEKTNRNFSAIHALIT